MKKSKHFRLLNSHEVTDLLDVMCKTLESITLYRTIDKEPYHCHFHSYSVSKKSEYRLTLKPPLFNTGIEDQKVFIIFERDQIQFMAQGETGKFDDVLHLTLSSEIYRIDKRDNFRVEFNLETAPVVEVYGKKFSLLDISVGGLAFFSNESEQLFKQNDYVKDIQFELSSTLFLIPSSLVRYVGPMKEKEGMKIGLQFLSLSPTVEAKLFTAINQRLFPRNRI